MKKTQVAFQMSTERLAERGRLYFWTFTFAETLDIIEARTRWNHFLTLMRRRWPKMCGLRVFELHKSHGLHVHLVTDGFLDVNQARSMATRAGWGRIHVKRIPAHKAGYLGKYLSKERPECFKRWRLWAAFGKDWTWTKVGNLEKSSTFCRSYRAFRDRLGWKGNKGFFKRAEIVRGFVESIVGSDEEIREGWAKGELRDAIIPPDVVLIW